MTLSRCPLSIFCSPGTPPRVLWLMLLRSRHNILFEFRLFTDEGADIFYIERYGANVNLTENLLTPNRKCFTTADVKSRFSNLLTPDGHFSMLLAQRVAFVQMKLLVERHLADTR